MCALAIVIGCVSCTVGLLVSYHFAVPSGPAIILSAGAIYLGSILAGSRGILNTRLRPHRHRTA